MNKKIKILISLTIFSVLTYWFVIPLSIKIIYGNAIPELPNLTGYSQHINDIVNQAYTNALEKPYSDIELGNLGMVYHSNFFYAEAESCYTNAKKLNDKEWLWYYYTALLKEELGDTKETIANLKRVVEINPKVTYAWFKLGNSYLKLNLLDDAEVVFKKAVNSEKFNFSTEFNNKETFPLIAHARLNLSRVFIKQKNYDEAHKELEKLLEEYQRFGPAYRLLGQLMFLTGDSLKGKELTIRAGDFDSFQPLMDPIYSELFLKSRNTNFILKQIDIALKSENSDLAEILCQHILQFDPTDIEAISKYVLVLLVKSKYENLGDFLKKYYKYYIDNDEKLFVMAETLNRWNQNGYALMFTERIINVNPNLIKNHILYLKLRASNSVDESLVKHCEKVLELDPKNSELITEYGRLLALQGQTDKARSQFKVALNLNPTNEIALILLGILYEENGDVPIAIKYYQRSIAANPLNVNTVLKLGNYYLRLNRYKEALKLFEKSLKNSPNNLELLERHAWILSVSSDQSIRDGKLALTTAKRISLMRKDNPDQEIRSVITLAAAYAENENFSIAINILNSLINRAKQTQSDRYIPQIEEMIKLYKENKFFRI
ncbi:MAG: tetratricopeptide repeat protein [Ignavibacteriales bacterium]|nr:tetratricopeptide repeat protein [Ignavibacteriales bacterium]